MSLAATPAETTAPRALLARQPNEFDLARIGRLLVRRRRYRYVEPVIVPIEDGYLVRAPCCSRTVDPQGGEIDIARLVWVERAREWRLFRRNHGPPSWIEDGRFARLGELMAWLNADPDRVFWQ
ncbi:hypothetical protein [Novosphingobium sp. BW1]|uniref:DUF3024 domain-containing protein n=1 Tax=Novosphingobium sp. BW1 TaxID=2592621 RepID=UPI0011DEC433|nr:hypothetical protein [Novosphingobium sp. BW1]TYC85137.1 hypothetical protein FMM79_18795 [Novosphingobium sp. BW1]